MRYVGGKHHHGRMIARAITVAGHGRTTYREPFVGGGNVLVHIPATFTRYATDIHPDLILMWQAVQDGWTPPEKISKTAYAALKHAEPSALRGFVGFGASFGAKWFAGYGKGSHQVEGATSRWLSEHTSDIQGVHFACADYRDTPADEHTVIYADPPYGGTTEYPGVPPFDTSQFWHTAGGWVDAGAVVLVSEYDAPPGWLPVRSRDRLNRLRMEQKGSTHPEMLYRSPGERTTRSFNH